jgi:cellulase/cellobiase CelA1
MFQAFNPPRGRDRSRRLSEYFQVLAAFFLTLLASSASAQVTHVTNPYAGATVYVSPDYATEVGSAIATEPAGSTLAKQMSVVATYPTFVWMDHIGAIAGGTSNNGRLGLQGHINAALAQQKGTEPVVVQLVIYDLPDRDCAALASNGELSIAGGDTPIGSTTPLTGTGIQEYENDYITPIYNILAQYKSNPNIRFVLVIEDDSLPNMITNTGLSFSLPNCIAANDGKSGSPSLNGVYVVGIQYALNQFHSLANAYNYLDIGHHGWLGWPANSAIAFPFFANVAKGTTAGFASVDGFITNTANYGPTKEPYMTAFTEPPGTTTGTGTLCATPEVCSGTFYQYNPEIDEEDYAAEFDAGFISAGFPSTLGFLIDTSRNGWGGPLRPAGPGTSTVVDTFVNQTKLDQRDDMGQWCNQANQGLGVAPTVTPGYFANLNAYVWVKPPGESDGNYPGSVYNGVTSTKGDPNCDPAHDNMLANGMATGAIPNSPPAGTFWVAEFVEDVQNAFPPIPATTAPGFSVSATGVSIEQGTIASSSITVSAINGFDSAVALSVSGLPAGVTAVFSPSSVTGSAGSTLTFTASNTATVGEATLTVTGTSGSTIETANLTLTVTAEPNFTISASPAAVSLPAGTNPTSTITLTFVGGLTGSVSLSASGLPAGANANFAPSSLNGSGTSVVNFNSQTSTPAGTYNVSITGTNGTITHSATIVLTVPGTGFTLAPSAPTLSIAPASTATDTITVTDAGGFTGSITLAASGLPSGVTAAFGTNPATSSSVLTLTASSTAAAGGSTITITGTSGSVTATTTIALTVSSASGFTLAPSASPLSVTQGKTATDTITVTDKGGFTGSVTLAASGLPGGVTATFGTNPTTGSSVLTLTASSTATVGTSTVTITGTSGSVTATTTIALTVTSAATGSFTLKPSASTLSITQGSSATDTITVTDVSPFAGSVTLAASGLPGGVTAAFGTNPTTGSSVLTLTAGSTATAGTSTVTITGTSGSLTATTTLALTVNPAPSFTLAPSASTLPITQGSSATDTIAVTDVGGFTGSVTLAASGLPSGVTAAFGTNPTTGSSVLTLTASSTATAGAATVTITGTSGTVTATTTIALNVSALGTGAKCTIDYTISSQWGGGFGAAITINNTGTTALTSWTLTWTFANGQTVTNLWNGSETQSGANVTVKNLSYNGSIPAGGSYTGMGFNGSWNNTSNAIPTAFSLNGTACTVN